MVGTGRVPIYALYLALLAATVLLGLSLAQSFGGYVVLAVDRAKPAHLGRRELATYVREATARALFVSLTPLRWRKPAVPTHTGERPPVVLLADAPVHGGALVFLQSFLEGRGYTTWRLDLRDRSASLAEKAERLAEAVERVARQSNHTQVDLVAHGVGGVVAAWYLARLDGVNHCRRLITLGTPFRGTRMAVFGRHRHSQEILHGNPILAGLTPVSVPTACVWSSDDPVVVPSESGLADQAESIRVDAAGHVEMLTSARIFRAVDDALSKPLPPRATPAQPSGK